MGNPDPKAVDHEGAREIASGPVRQRVIYTMVQYFGTLGFKNIQARVAPLKKPPLLYGVPLWQRPDLTCERDNEAKTPIVLEAVTAAELLDLKSPARWKAISDFRNRQSDADQKKFYFELHFAVLAWDESGAPTLKDRLKSKLFAAKVPFQHIWEL